jgi:hypothetical protein
MNYCIDEHRHRFAAWAAGRAVSATVGGRFKGKLAKAILEEAGLNGLISSVDLLPPVHAMDDEHRRRRGAVIEAANKYGLQFTHGVAAKLINIYLKSAFVCGGHHHDERVKALHPPIDRELLKELASKDIGGHKRYWKRASDRGWTKITSNEYEELIRALRNAMNGALWMAEEYWCGYQQGKSVPQNSRHREIIYAAESVPTRADGGGGGRPRSWK